MLDHDGQAERGLPAWRLWISSTGRHWAIRCTILTAAQVAAGARPILWADVGPGLAALIHTHDALAAACHLRQGPCGALT